MQIICIAFLDLMLNNKTLADLNCLHLLNDFKENNKAIKNCSLNL